MKAEIDLYVANVLDKTISNITISVRKMTNAIHTDINSVDEEGEDLNLASFDIPIDKALFLANSIIKMCELEEGRM